MFSVSFIYVLHDFYHYFIKTDFKKREMKEERVIVSGEYLRIKGTKGTKE